MAFGKKEVKKAVKKEIEEKVVEKKELVMNRKEINNDPISLNKTHEGFKVETL